MSALPLFGLGVLLVLAVMAFVFVLGLRLRIFSIVDVAWSATGLWRYSRHPNYFFEWLVWVSYFVFALPSPWGWTQAAAPLVMLWFLFRVTGIPLTEAQARRSRDDYRDYQRSTSAFLPWFPKR